MQGPHQVAQQIDQQGPPAEGASAGWPCRSSRGRRAASGMAAVEPAGRVGGRRARTALPEQRAGCGARANCAIALRSAAFCLSHPPARGQYKGPGRRRSRAARMRISNAMWGGRFAEGPSAVMRAINASISFDKRLWRQDIAASRIHVAMLAANNIVSRRMPTRSRRGWIGSRTNMRPTASPKGGARGHSYACRAPPRRTDRPGGGAAAHRPLAQRPGGDGLQAVGARRDRCLRNERSRRCSGRWWRAPPNMPHGHAGLHPFASPPSR